MLEDVGNPDMRIHIFPFSFLKLRTSLSIHLTRPLIKYGYIAIFAFIYVNNCTHLWKTVKFLNLVNVVCVVPKLSVYKLSKSITGT